MNKKFSAVRFLGLFVVLLISIGCNTLCRQSGGTFCDVTPNEAADLIAERDNLVILDVRTDSEVVGGMISNAIHINYNGDDFRSEVDALDKTVPYLVYCKAGSRSDGAQKIMHELGFSEVYDLTGGYSAWISAGYGYEIP